MTIEQETTVEATAGLQEQLSVMAEAMRDQQDETARLRLKVIELSADAASQNEPSEVSQLERPSSRRQLLRTGAAALGAGVVAVGLGSKSAAAADDDPLLVGRIDNVAASPTTLTSTVSGGSSTFDINNTETTGFGYGIFSGTDADQGVGVWGNAKATSGTPIGVLGTTPSPTGHGLLGDAQATSGSTIGVEGIAHSPAGNAVVGRNSATTGTAHGVWGRTGSTEGQAVLGETDATTGSPVGVQGLTGAPGGTGVIGRNASAAGEFAGVGVLGENAATSGLADGVRAISNSPDGRAICAENNGVSGISTAVFGSSDSPTGIGGWFNSAGAAVAATGKVSIVPFFDLVNQEPVAPLHIKQSGSPDLVELLLQLESTKPPQQTFVNNTSGVKWFFAMTSDDEFKISRDGTGKVEAKFFQNGDLRIAGSLIQSSDVNVKHDIEEVDPQNVLDKLAAMPVSTWKYDSDPDTVHLGPTAQDFSTAFGLGNTTTGIAAVDADGVALAAIKALHQQNLELRAEVDELKEALTS